MKKLPVLLALIAICGFVYGLIHLFNLRFDAGDNYPPYSSLRADPLGSKALYESVDALLPARRHRHPLSKLGEGRETTLLWLGEEAKNLRFLPGELKELEAFVRTGGRLVIGLLPVLERPQGNRIQTLAARRKGGPVAAPTNNPAVPPLNGMEDPEKIAISDRWNLSFDYSELSREDDNKIIPAPAVRRDAPDDLPLPRSIGVHSALYFSKLDPDWRVLYARLAGTNVHPVVVERVFGKGSIVLSADSYYFSNEALRAEREPGLLAWFLGPAREVIFEETHLGVQEDPGVMTLARKYRLGGLFLALALLGGLFIWRNSASFMPPDEEQLAWERGAQVEGKDSASGFINLLRRNIAPADLMKVCLEQWNAHFALTRKPSVARLEAMQKIIDAENLLEPRQRDPVGTYQKLCDILSKRDQARTPKIDTRNSTLEI
jgi:hypothetical protein